MPFGCASLQARRLRCLFEELGRFWVKVGQLMSVRNDIFSAELCDELSRLQDQAMGFPFETAHRIAEAELKQQLSQIFDAFDEKPFAAASIGQLHRAHLRYEKVWVAVKIQRPFVAQTINNPSCPMRAGARHTGKSSISCARLSITVSKPPT